MREFRSKVLGLVWLSLWAAGCGGSSSSSPKPPPPAAPAALVASAGVGQATLDWTPSPGATSYTVYVGTAAGVTRATGTPITGVASPPRVVLGLANGTTYHVVVTAVGPGGESAESVERSVTPATSLTPPAPRGLRAVPGDGPATGSWSPTPGGASYDLYWSTAAGAARSSGTKLVGAVSPAVVTGLANGTTVYFAVAGVSPNGEGVASLEASCTPSATPPPPPPAVVAAAGGDGQVTVAWPPSAGATSYAVYLGSASNVSASTGARVPVSASPAVVTGLANDQAWFVVVAAIGPSGEGTPSDEARAFTVAGRPAFAQADLAGQWDVLQFGAGAFAGWARVLVGVDAAGQVTVLDFLDESGSTALPAPGFDLRATIDVAGTVLLGGADGSASFRGRMAASKTLVFATDTESDTAPSPNLWVWRKRVAGVTYTAADVASFPFTYHAVHSGAAARWERGAGSTDAAGLLTVSASLDSLGNASPPGAVGALAVDAAGRVGLAPDLHGLMTTDKKAIFLVDTTGDPTAPSYAFRVVIRSGRGHAAGDLAGRYDVHVVTSTAAGGPTPTWNRGELGVDAAGNVTFLSYVSSLGPNPLPAGFQLLLDGAGAVTRPGDATYGGQLAWGSDFYVRTAGSATAPSLAVGVR
ncbi:MAG TPA: fibronectin type III domain-containing protein [Anaeromyxobacteraceae bacterium]|nr:fibronectin type III domain-containing protein [Anaeromyxobacteraceae bacterium]